MRLGIKRGQEFLNVKLIHIFTVSHLIQEFLSSHCYMYRCNLHVGNLYHVQPCLMWTLHSSQPPCLCNSCCEIDTFPAFQICILIWLLCCLYYLVFRFKSWPKSWMYKLATFVSFYRRYEETTISHVISYTSMNICVPPEF